MSLVRIALPLLCTLSACSAGIVEQSEDSETAGELINAALDSAHPEVGKVYHRMPDGTTVGLCTGTLIGTHTVLTAGHCVAEAGGVATPERMSFVLGDQRHAVQRVALKDGYDATRVPSGDLAVLELVGNIPDLRPMRVSLTPPVVNEPVVLIGYGRYTDAMTGDQQKRVGTNQVAQITATWFSMTGASGDDSGVCHGDSGGPTLAARGGAMVVAGVHSTATCDHQPTVNGVDGDVSRDTRVDAYLDFVKAAAQGNLYAGGAYEQLPPTLSATLLAPGGGGQRGGATPMSLRLVTSDDLEVDRIVVFINGARAFSLPIHAAGFTGDVPLASVPSPRPDGSVWIQVAAVDRGARRTNVDIVY